MRSAVAVLHDQELVELLGTQPDLLAIADAIAATLPPPRRRRLPARGVVAGCALVASVMVALVAPWSNSRGGVLERALAAVSPPSVLHVVLVSNIPDAMLVDLRTRTAVPTRLRVETWFDTERGLRKTVVARSGSQTAVELATPQGVWSDAGRVPTCAWIAAHPIEATRLRVSCSASGRNGTIPRLFAEARPEIDPALAAFITGYRGALRSHQAQNLGPGRVGARAVYWIGFTVGAGRALRHERVAVDRHTFRPVVYETVAGGRVLSTARIVAIASVAFRPSLFARPALDAHAQAVIGQVAKARHVSRSAAESALGGRARSVGDRFGSLPLIDARIDRLTTGYGALSKRPVTRGTGVEFVYGDGGGVLTGNSFLRVSEALTPEMAYGLQPEGRSLRVGSLLLTRFENKTVASNGKTASSHALWVGQTRAGVLYVSLQGSSRQLVVSAARALEGIK